MRTDIKVFFYFIQNYYSDSVKVLEIVDQLSACLCESCNCFCKWFSHYLEKSIEDFIYIRSTELLLLIYNIQNIILDHLWEWLYYLSVLKVIYITQICLWFFWEEAVLQHICFLLSYESSVLSETITELHYCFRMILCLILIF